MEKHFPEVNILFGSLSPSNKISIGVTVSVPLGSLCVCVYLCTYVHGSGQHSPATKDWPLSFSAFLTLRVHSTVQQAHDGGCQRPVSCSLHRCYNMAGHSPTGWITGWSSDFNCQFVSVLMLHCDELQMHHNEAFKRQQLRKCFCAWSAVLMHRECDLRWFLRLTDIKSNLSSTLQTAMDQSALPLGSSRGISSSLTKQRKRERCVSVHRWISGCHTQAADAAKGQTDKQTAALPGYNEKLKQLNKQKWEWLAYIQHPERTAYWEGGEDCDFRQFNFAMRFRWFYRWG